MANFSVKNAGVQSGAQQLDQVSRELQKMEMEILVIRGSLGFEVASANAIRSRLGTLSQNIQRQRRNTGSMATGLRQTAQKYRNTESRICGRTKAGNSLRGIISQVISAIPGGKLDFILDDFKNLKDFMSQFFTEPGGGKKSWLELLLTAPAAYEGLINWVDGLKDDIKDGIVDFTTIEGEAKADWKLWEAGVSGEYGSAGVTALAAEAYASGSAGLFTKNDDGELIFNPNIDAQMGASFTALHMDAKGHVGNEMLGAKGNASVDVGKVAAAASTTVGMFDEHGNLDPRLKASASAEAIAIEAKGEAGVTVLGAEAKVSGSVNVGIGAHADVGYADGVFSLDIGASLGVGASIAFEVDVGGFVNTVADVAKCILPWLK